MTPCLFIPSHVPPARVSRPARMAPDWSSEEWRRSRSRQAAASVGRRRNYLAEGFQH